MRVASPRRVPRLLAIALMLAVALAATPLPAAAQVASQPENYLLSLINAARAESRLVALRWDTRLADVAQWRSDDMVANNYFGHISFDRLSSKIAAAGITWYHLGETLAKGTPRTAMESAEETLRTWQGSEPHWRLLTSADYNYIALGMARHSNGWYYWTALLLRGPDRTPPVATMGQWGLGAKISGSRTASIAWSGADVPLSILTAGLKDFRLQMRVGSGRWAAATDWTTATTKSFKLQSGKKYSFRVKARDRNGNRSVWSAPVTLYP